MSLVPSILAKKLYYIILWSIYPNGPSPSFSAPASLAVASRSQASRIMDRTSSGVGRARCNIIVEGATPEART